MKSTIQNIVKSILLVTLYFSLITAFAQAPQKFSYQTVVRNASNALVANANVGIKITILQGSATGTSVYSESHTAATNANGLASIQIGGGSVLSGNLTTINWSTATYFIKTEVDPAGGTAYSISGTTQLLSVPYALSSADNKWTVYGNNIGNNNSGSVCIGTTTPLNIFTGLTIKKDINDWFGTYIDAGATGKPFYGYALNGTPKAYTQYNGSNNNWELWTSNATPNISTNGTTGNVGIGTSTPTEKLEVAGKTKTTNLQVTTGAGAGKVLTSDATGNATWQTPATSGNTGWGLSGNAGTNSNTNFIGTTDDKDLIFKRNNVQSGLLNNASSNTSFGVNALNPATTGYDNTANGGYALYSNTTGYSNTANGRSALYSNTTGNYNTANGGSALYYNTTGNYNTANGGSALYSNTTGNYNTANGLSALSYNTTGNGNTAIGRYALSNLTTGSNNIGIGYDAQVPNNAGDNQVRIGNTAITYAGIQVAWTTTSDSRWKKNIQPSNLGLNFINDLKPVSYVRKNDATKKVEYGIIAQELEASLKKFGADTNGIITIDDQGMYGVRYNDLLAPMIKAIQEQQAMIKEQQAMIEELKAMNEKQQVKNEEQRAMIEKQQVKDEEQKQQIDVLEKRIEVLEGK